MGFSGAATFAREIIWHLRGAAGFNALAPNWVPGHDIILYYTMSKHSTFNKVWLPYDDKQLRRFSSRDSDGRRYKSITAKRRIYLDEAKGVPATSVWSDIASFQTVVNSPERMGYPTQKPLALYERIINASSNPGDIVLDPFAGCATTPIAAERLGRQWVAMDIWEGAADIVPPTPCRQPPASNRCRPADSLRHRAANSHRRRPGGCPVPASHRALRRT